MVKVLHMVCNQRYTYGVCNHMVCNHMVCERQRGFFDRGCLGAPATQCRGGSVELR